MRILSGDHVRPSVLKFLLSIVQQSLINSSLIKLILQIKVCLTHERQIYDGECSKDYYAHKWGLHEC